MSKLFLERFPRLADISDCGRYRYRLGRRWGWGPPLAFIMLNPSTADADVDDPTIRRCMGFARREGCGGIVVVNLFALRATDPAELRKSAVDPVGPENDMAIESLIDAPLATGARVVCAWGAHALAEKQARRVVARARSCGRQLWCLGKTRIALAPRHPLYVDGEQQLEAFP